MFIWTVANQKGGVGKSTTSVALAGLAAEQGFRVLLVDLDPHGSLTTYFRQNPDTLELSAFNLFQGRKNLNRDFIHQLIIETDFKRLSLLPASPALATLERKVIGQDGMGLVLSEALALLSEDYDLVLVDSPPLLGVLMINALAACHQLVIPVQTEFLSIKGLERMMNTLQMMGRSNRSDMHYSIVPTMYDKRTQASVSSLLSLRNTYKDSIWPGKIPIDTRFRDASKAGIPPHLYASDSRGVEAYRSLVKWLWRKRDTAARENRSPDTNACEKVHSPKTMEQRL